jgi:dynein heavy chain
MALTGQSFDLDPKTFTLSNMFAMQLHKYKDDIAKVTSCALKELTIENEIRKLAETWQEQRFDLHKYHSVSWGVLGRGTKQGRLPVLQCCSLCSRVRQLRWGFKCSVWWRVLTSWCVLYLQGGAERGWVLKGVEEINLLLEDMGLNLQSMMASPHVRPFADEVRNWEQRLSLIGEAIEVRRSFLH